MLVSKLAASKSLAPVYVQDVFKTSTYTGTGASRTITTNVDLANDGGLVWIKQRDNADRGHVLFDTLNDTYFLTPSGNSTFQTSTAARTDAVSSQVDFLSTGFDLGTDTAWSINNYYVGNPYVAWSFKRQPKFFDVVTWVGDGNTDRTIPHNLQSTPGFIVVKNTTATSASGYWYAYHRSLSVNYPYIVFNNSFAQFSANSAPAPILGDASNIYVHWAAGTDYYSANENGVSYVAYIFAHDAGGFGPSGSDSIIKCGSYLGNGSASGPTVTLGFEPQWVLIKSITNTGNWYIADSTRGFTKLLIVNSQTYEYNISPALLSTSSTGFQITNGQSLYNQNGQTYIYVAIAKES